MLKEIDQQTKINCISIYSEWTENKIKKIMSFMIPSKSINYLILRNKFNRSSTRYVHWKLQNISGS